jgi:hypothetical protein
MPKVRNADTKKLIADAFEAVNAMLVLEMEQTNWFIKGWDGSSRTPPEDGVVRINNDVNRNPALPIFHYTEFIVIMAIVMTTSTSERSSSSQRRS